MLLQSEGGLVMSIMSRNLARRENAYKLGVCTLDEWWRYTKVDHPELYQCAACGIGPQYNGKPLVLQLDHIDGDRKNNIQSNFRWLCPNCHTQTETWGQKGKRNRSCSCVGCRKETRLDGLMNYHKSCFEEYYSGRSSRR